MALGLDIIQQATDKFLDGQKAPDILGQYQKMQALRTMQLNQQDIASQVQERNSLAAQRQAEMQQTQDAAQAYHDYLFQNPNADLSDPNTLKQIHQAVAIHSPKIADGLFKTLSEAANSRADTAIKQKNADTAAATLAETQKKSAADQARKDAEDMAGTLIAGSEFTSADANGKPSRAAQFRVRQADGTYKNETRLLGQEMAAPQNPPQPTPPMSSGLFTQRELLAKIAADAAAARAAASTAIPPLDFLTEQSSTGVPFIDSSKVEPKTLNALQSAAGAAGKKVVDKETAQGLRDIKTAKDNQQSMMDMLNGRLADNPVSRLFVAPENKLKQIGQIDPNLAATGTFLGPAIANLRAVAGAKNFRITKAEIDSAVQNFVPLASDTVDTARAKMAALGHFMDNKEKVALGVSSSASPGGATGIRNGTIWTKDSTGWHDTGRKAQ